MDIIELGAIGELVGGVAVVASLIYVGLQVRQSTSVARTSSHHWIIESFNQWNLAVAADPTLVRVIREGIQSRSGLNEDERGQFDWLLLSAFRLFETVHHQSQSGFAEEHLLVEQERGFVAILSGAGAQEWWRENAYPFSSEFNRYIEGLLPGAVSGGASSPEYEASRDIESRRNDLGP